MASRLRCALRGATNADDPRAVDMGNPDIGVLVKDSSGKILVPNDANSTTLLDFEQPGFGDSPQCRDSTAGLTDQHDG